MRRVLWIENKLLTFQFYFRIKNITFVFNSAARLLMKNRSEKTHLVRRLKDQKPFWSYDMQDVAEVPDEILIEKTLLYLDIDEINLLFRLFPVRKIKQVWLNRLVVQGEYYGRLNKFLAWMYFDIKKPESYLKRMENRHLKNLL